MAKTPRSTRAVCATWGLVAGLMAGLGCSNSPGSAIPPAGAACGQAGAGDHGVGGNAGNAGTPGTSHGGGGGAGASGGGSGSGGGPAGSEGGSGGATSGAGGGGATDAAGDLGSPGAGDARPDGGAAGPGRVLFYTHQTAPAYRHPSIETAVAQFKTLLGTVGLTSDTSEDPAVLTAANLGKYSGVVLINTNGLAFGDPGTSQIEALVGFVRAGGGLVGFHAASSPTYPPTGPFAGLLGAATKDQPGSYRTANCYPEGKNPAVAALPTPYQVRGEEFYTFDNFNPANQVVLRCDALTGTEKLPIAWVREEGAGRIFFSGLGHVPALWTTGQFFTDHAWPGFLWAIGRTPP